MMKHEDKINWELVSQYQSLSETFIEKYANKLDWIYIAEYQTL